MAKAMETMSEWILRVPGNPVTTFGGLVVLAMCISLLARQLQRNSSKPNIPRYEWDAAVAGSAKKRWMWDSLRLLREGYFKFDGKPWQVWTSEGYQVVLPPTYIDELKMLPDHTFPSFLRDFMLPEYTFKPFPPWKLDYVNHVILHDLNKNMAKIFPAIRKGVDTALSIEFPTCTEWSEIDILTRLVRITARVSGIAFVGPELESDEEWIDMGCSYTKDGFLAALKLRAIPAFLRPLAAPLISDLRRVYRSNDRARVLIQQVVQQRGRDANTVPAYEKPKDTIQWMYDLIPATDKENYALQGALQLAIIAVSVQSTSKFIGNVILNLMKYEDYVPIMKEEIQTILAECGGQWTLESMGRLEKLDSFMRETLRFEPPLTATFQRQAKKPIELLDGTILPEGTLAFTPSDAIAFDPNLYPDPETFDGLRFYKLRQQAEASGKAATKVRHQFVATSRTAVQFGLGRHACPGRWFASHLIKMAVAAILLRYDFKFRAGEGRLKTFLFQTTNMPDPKTRILMRRKKDVLEGG